MSSMRRVNVNRKETIDVKTEQYADMDLLSTVFQNLLFIKITIVYFIERKLQIQLQ